MTICLDPVQDCLNELEALRSTPIKDQKVTYKGWERIYRRPDRPDLKEIHAYHSTWGTIWVEDFSRRGKYKLNGVYYRTFKEAAINAKIQGWEKKLKELSQKIFSNQ